MTSKYPPFLAFEHIFHYFLILSPQRKFWSSQIWLLGRLINVIINCNNLCDCVSQSFNCNLGIMWCGTVLLRPHVLLLWRKNHDISLSTYSYSYSFAVLIFQEVRFNDSSRPSSTLGCHFKCMWKWLMNNLKEFPIPQNRLFCLFTYAFKSKCISSLIICSWKSEFSRASCNILFSYVRHSKTFSDDWILYGIKCKPSPERSFELSLMVWFKLCLKQQQCSQPILQYIVIHAEACHLQTLLYRNYSQHYK